MKRRAFLGYVAALPFADQLLAFPATKEVVYRAHEREIQVLRRQANAWRIVQRIGSERPGSLVLSSKRDVLFAVNQLAEFEGCPAGSVESFAVDARSGLIESIGRRALSLSSTNPRACALSPDNRYLVVAAYGGGTYNVLSIFADGTVGPVCHVRKEIGSGPDTTMQQSSHPHSVAFAPSGRFVIATDFGADRVNVFDINEGRLSLVQRLSSPAGSGPGSIRLSKLGNRFTVYHELSGHLECFDWDERQTCSPARLRSNELDRPTDGSRAAGKRLKLL